MNDTSEAEPAREIRQRLRWMTRQHLRLRDGKLHCRVQGLGSLDEFTIPLQEIDPNAARLKSSPLTWLITAIALFLGALALVVAGFNASSRDESAFYGVACVVGIGAIILAVVWFANRLDVFVFRCSRGAILVHATRPNLQEAKEFANALHNAIENAGSVEKRVIRALLTALNAEGYLDEWQLEKARKRFEHFSEQ